MTIEVCAFKSVPDFAKGHVKDLRVRWALEEAGLEYGQDLIDPDIQASAAYRKRQPFGQVPAFRDGDVDMFESGAIVLHIARRSEALAPGDAAGYARVSSWVFAALNSIEPQVSNVVMLDLFYKDEPWADGYRPAATAMLKSRLDDLAAWLGDGEYLEDRFTAGDVVMTTVLRDLNGSGILADYPTLDAYRRRCEARPAFGRALAAQLQAFRDAEAAA